MEKKKQLNSITVYSIVYNNYGHFIPQWIEWIKKQTVIPNILIVLGEKHGADLKWLRKNNIKYIIKRTSNMGKLRNAGKAEIETDWALYFSIDDELLPHACEEIINTNAEIGKFKVCSNRC